MTAASSRTPRSEYEPRHAFEPCRPHLVGQPRIGLVVRQIGNRTSGVESPRHAADEHTPPERTVPAIVERVR